MNYRSIADLGRDIGKYFYKLPPRIDLVVGIPRSGMLPASIIALHLNCKFCDIDSFIENRPLKSGDTRGVKNQAIQFPQQAKHVVVVDDSVWSGAAMVKARDMLKDFGGDRSLQFGAVYVTEESEKYVDFAFARVDMPRAFEWNLFHRSGVDTYCVDIDGVLCVDPTEVENDDGPEYVNFLQTARCLARPSKKIGHLVTSRLTRYRSQTEGWLAGAGIEFGELHMLDVATAAERRQRGLHGSFKAEVYKGLPESRLFIESEPHQALLIANAAGKPVLDFSQQKMVYPGLGAPLAIDFAERARRKIWREFRQIFS